MPYIYVLRDKITSEVRYVGLTRDLKARARRYRHKGHTKHLDNWLKKSGSSIPKPIAEVSEQNASQAERFWIIYFRLQGARLLNFTDGGESGFKTNAEVRKALGEKTRQRLLGKKQNPETVRKRAIALKGHKVSPETAIRLTKLNKARIGVPLSPSHLKKIHALWTPERRFIWSERSKKQHFP